MSEEWIVAVGGEEVRVTSPSKMMFPQQGWTKRDVVDHFTACVDGALTGVFGRPTMLKRWPGGVGEKPFYQKRAPESAVERIRVEYPSGRSAAWLVPRSPADVIWMAQLNCLDLNPWTSRAEHLELPDELRIDLDPTPDATFGDVRSVALIVGHVLEDHGLVGWPKISGASGMHVYVRIEPRWSFTEVRRAALAVGRAVEDEVPHLATTAWWKEDRHGVFVDYNQNTRDHTIASAYSVRPTGLVSAPVTWSEVPDIEPSDFPMVGFADRYRLRGDLMEGIDEAVGRIDSLLDLADRQDADREGALSVLEELLMQPVLEVAPQLLGMAIRTEVCGKLVVIRLNEVEAYVGDQDPASHAYRGRTPRNASMFESAGTLYVYRSYGLHWCMNVVVGPQDLPHAVLLRGGVVVAGRVVVEGRRGRSNHLADGPGKLTQALGVTGEHDGTSVLHGPIVLGRDGSAADPQQVRATPRIGISKAVDRPWRFVLARSH